MLAAPGPFRGVLSDGEGADVPQNVLVVGAMATSAVVLLSTVALAGDSAASAALRSSGSASGVWPGVGQICGPGAGGASSPRGVSTKAIHIAVFTDASNTVEPGLDIEFPQFAKAFADWCNAAGGIDGRQIDIDTEDAAFFNAGQVMTQACQQDFMSVGGGLVLDTAAVPIRVACGLGQITSFTVSDVSVDAALQVNPGGVNNSEIEAGWYGALAKKYPTAIKHFGMGGENEASILEQEHKNEQAAEAQGYKVIDFQEPPLSVTDWAPYIEEAQSKGVEGLEPAAASNVAPYFQAMQTAGYDPAFVYMFSNLYVKATASHGLDAPASDLPFPHRLALRVGLAESPASQSSSPSCTSTPLARPLTRTTSWRPVPGCSSPSRLRPAVPTSPSRAC